MNIDRRAGDTAWSPELRLLPGIVEAALDRAGAQPWFKYVFRERASRWDVWRPCVWMAEHVPTDAHVLSVGCGAGFNLFWLAEHGFRNLWGCDIDPRPIDAAVDIALTVGLPATFWVDDALQPQYLPAQRFSVIEALNWTHLLEDFSLARLLDVYLPSLAPDGLFIFDAIDIAFNQHPDNAYATADWSRPVTERRPSEYRSRVSEAEVRDVLATKDFRLVSMFREEQTIPKVVYVARRNDARLSAVRDDGHVASDRPGHHFSQPVRSAQT